MIDRRALLVAAICPLTFSPVCGDSLLHRVEGEVNSANFDRLWAFMNSSVGQTVGLDISCRPNDDEEDADFSCIVSHGVFGVLSGHGEDKRALAFPNGARSISGKYHADGFYMLSRESAQMIGLMRLSDKDVTPEQKQMQPVNIDELPGVKN